MQKIYMSRAATRTMALDHPIGDPTGGPAFGEKHDAVSAVISIGSMIGAASGGIAAMTLTSGLVFAGGALSLVGNITGNKTLSKIGMVTGLAGGVGMLGEWAAGSTIGGDWKVGDMLGGGADASSAAASNAGALSNTPTAVNPAEAARAEIMSGASPVDPMAASGGQAGASYDLMESSSIPGGPSNAYSLNAPGGGTSPLGLSMNAGGAGGLAVSPGATDMLYQTGRAAPGFMDLLKAGNYGDALSAAGTNVMNLAKSNPGAAMMLAQATGGAADWLSGKTDAEIAAIESQIGFADARALQVQEEIAKEKRRRTNLNQGYQQVNASIPVNPNANIPMPFQQPPQNQQYIPQPQNPGLIQGAVMPRA